MYDFDNDPKRAEMLVDFKIEYGAAYTQLIANQNARNQFVLSRILKPVAKIYDPEISIRQLLNCTLAEKSETVNSLGLNVKSFLNLLQDTFLDRFQWISEGDSEDLNLGDLFLYTTTTSHLTDQNTMLVGVVMSRGEYILKRRKETIQKRILEIDIAKSENDQKEYEEYLRLKAKFEKEEESGKSS